MPLSHDASKTGLQDDAWDTARFAAKLPLSSLYATRLNTPNLVHSYEGRSSGNELHLPSFCFSVLLPARFAFRLDTECYVVSSDCHVTGIVNALISQERFHLAVGRNEADFRYDAGAEPHFEFDFFLFDVRVGLGSFRLLHPIAWDVQLKDYAVVNKTVYRHGGCHRIFEDAFPLRRRQVT